jgi:Nif-specific regulatory protein
MEKILQFVESIAKAPDTTVLIEGEMGSGKELIAQSIHQESPRAKGPFITINVSAIPSELLESELFGSEEADSTERLKRVEKGRFELAQGGTLLLDEISELPETVQVSLLRVLEEREFCRVGGTRRIELDVRVIAATTNSLEETTEAGQFRDDLYYRLSAAKIRIPPLRERREDIIPISEFYIDRFNKRYGKEVRSISENAKKVLTSGHWERNVNELQDVLERILRTQKATVLKARHLSSCQSAK